MRLAGRRRARTGNSPSLTHSPTSARGPLRRLELRDERRARDSRAARGTRPGRGAARPAGRSPGSPARRSRSRRAPTPGSRRTARPGARPSTTSTRSRSGSQTRTRRAGAVRQLLGLVPPGTSTVVDRPESRGTSSGHLLLAGLVPGDVRRVAHVQPVDPLAARDPRRTAAGPAGSAPSAAPRVAAVERRRRCGSPSAREGSRRHGVLRHQDAPLPADLVLRGRWPGRGRARSPRRAPRRPPRGRSRGRSPARVPVRLSSSRRASTSSQPSRP